MYELKVSKLFSEQIKKIAVTSQPLFHDISESWDVAHRTINDLGKKGNPFRLVTFVVKVNKRAVYLVCKLDEKKKDFWVEAIMVKNRGKFVVYKP